MKYTQTEQLHRTTPNISLIRKSDVDGSKIAIPSAAAHQTAFDSETIQKGVPTLSLW